VDTIDEAQITGYAPEDSYLATRYTQGSRRVFDFELPLIAIPQVFPVPDPERPTLGNRRVKPSHARGFADYVREHEEWVAPALLMRAPDVFRFEELKSLGRVSFGILKVPRSARRDIRIIDGQHRILGLHYAVEDLAREIDEAREAVASGKRAQNHDLVVYEEKRVKKLERQRQRLEREFLAVQVHVETDAERYEQMFYDVADNALGITQAVKVRFDSRKVMNRALDAALRHAMIRDRVDTEQDRIVGSNPHLMGAKHVVDLVRTVNIGITGRVSRRQEDELDEGALVQKFNEFADVMLEAFPDLAAVADGTLEPVDLRKSSLLGSSTMLRVLAGVYFELGRKGYSDDEIAEFFGKLAPTMAAPVTGSSPWLKARSGVFSEGATAPTARRQDLRKLTDEITDWMDSAARPSWLAA
jgi:hypothetical protein